MKIKESHWHEAAKADQNEQLSKETDAARRGRTTTEQANAANRNRASDASSKDETKFASLLETSAKQQKTVQRQGDSSEERRDDRHREKKYSASDKDSSERVSGGDGKTEKNESYGGQTSGGQSGFGANVNQLNLSESFAARSILHIADLERLVSTVRAQINLGGRREIIVQMKRSVLEGLQVKITTDPGTRVQIQFLAANEKVRSQIEGHSAELAEILRGRGINLGSLTASLDSETSSDANVENENSSIGQNGVQESPASLDAADSSADNTFSGAPAADKIYQA